MKMTHKYVFGLLLAAFAAPMVAEQQDGDHGDVVRAAPTVTLNLLKDYVANVTGKGYNAASMNNVALYELALQGGGGGSSGGTLTNSSTVGNVTLGSLVNSSTVGNVTLGSLVKSPTVGNVTLGSLVNSSTAGNITLGSLVNDASIGNATLATLIAAAYNLVFSPTAGNVTLGSLVNGATFGNVTLGSLVNNSTFGNVTLGSLVNNSTVGNVTLGSLVNNSTVGNMTLGVISASYAYLTPIVALANSTNITWTDPATPMFPSSPALVTFTQTTLADDTINFTQAGVYLITGVGTFAANGGNATLTSILATGTAAATTTPALAISALALIDLQTVSFSFTQLVIATAGQTLIYTPTFDDTNGTVELNLFITRLS